MNVYEGLAARLPDKFAARLDLIRMAWHGPTSSPMNGQLFRQSMVRDIGRLGLDRAVETGAWHGTTTMFLAATLGVPLDSVEVAPRFYEVARVRLRREEQITLTRSDSRAFLRRLAARPEARTERTFFYLDAHWYAELPLAEELQIIAGGWSNAVVMIDDFKVPGDPGYSFDDYGPGKALVESYLPWGDLVGWRLFYPAAPSSAETGSRRGSCVLCSPAMHLEVGALTSLSESRRS